MIAFYAEFSKEAGRPEDIYKALESFSGTRLGHSWNVERDPSSQSSGGKNENSAFLIFPNGFLIVEDGEAWDYALDFKGEFVSQTGISEEHISVEPYTDLGFSAEVDDRRLLESLPGGAEETQRYDPATKNNRWSVRQIKALDAQNIFHVDGTGIRIGHLDTGQTPHREIINEGNLKIDLGWNTYENTADTLDPRDSKFKLTEPIRQPGHGTSTVSVLTSQAVSKGKTTTDIIGVAPGAEIIPFRTGNSQILTSKRLRASVSRAIELATDLSCNALSMSMGFITGSPEMRKAIDDATRKGVIVVAAGGQVLSGLKAPVWLWAKPAAYQNTIAVGASNVKGGPCAWSLRGTWIDVLAPGDGVWRAFWHQRAGEETAIGRRSWGTSYATPHVAGVVALWLELWNEKLEALVYKKHRKGLFRFVLRNCGLTDLGPNWGEGIIDAKKVLSYEWPENQDWLQFCENDQINATEYTWKEELALELYGNDLEAIPFSEFSASTEAALIESFDLKSDEAEELLENHFPELVFHLRANQADRRVFLGRIGNNLGAPEALNLLAGEDVRVESPAGQAFLYRASRGLQTYVTR